MRHTDARSRKIAVVSDRTLNAHLSADAAAVRFLTRLYADGYGLVQLPPAEVAPDVAKTAVLYAVDQLQDYAKNGYDVAVALLPQDDDLVSVLFQEECRSRGLDLTVISGD